MTSNETTPQTESAEQYLSDKAVAARYQVSRPTIWRWSQRGTLPLPILFSPGCTRWKLSDLIRAEADKAAKK